MAIAASSVAIGAPGAFTLWAFDAIRMLAARADGAVVNEIDRTDPIEPAANAPSVYLTRFPSATIIEAVANGDLKALVLLDDPVAGVEFIIATTGQSLLEAIRAHSASGVAHLAIGRAPEAGFILRPGDRRACEVLRQIADSLALPYDDAVIKDSLTRLGAANDPETSIDAVIARHMEGCASSALLHQTSSSAASRATIRAVLDPLAAMAQGAFHQPIVWPVGVFLYGDRPDEPAPPVVSIIGPARTLIYGPYFHLPPGEYRVEIVMAFSGRIDDIPFSLEMHGGSRLGRFWIHPRPSGEYVGRFRLRHENPADPIEIHLRNERGAIEGELALAEMRFFALPEHEAA